MGILYRVWKQLAEVTKDGYWMLDTGCWIVYGDKVKSLKHNTGGMNMDEFKKLQRH